jgi:hypothetical protein
MLLKIGDLAKRTGLTVRALHHYDSIGLHAPESMEAQALARRWFDLFRSFAGDNQVMQAKARQALMDEPRLTENGMMDDAMRGFIRSAMQVLSMGPGLRRDDES